ncbi:MAG: hypothetical protein NUV76_02380, partial [Candidatus Kuenenia sp.]|nr:hypothetical protein [Candidatus Kuenenia sp.]
RPLLSRIILAKWKRELPMPLRSQAGAWERAFLFFQKSKVLQQFSFLKNSNNSAACRIAYGRSICYKQLLLVPHLISKPSKFK